MVLEGRLRNINSRRRSRSSLIFASARQHHALISDKEKNYFGSYVIQSGNATLLQRFSKDYFAVAVEMTKCLHATSSNALFCTHYVGNVNYRSLITVTFPIGSIGKTITPC